MKQSVPFVFSAVLLTIPSLVWADGLVPCGGASEPACQFCHLMLLVQNVFDWLKTIFTIVFVITVVVSGLILATSVGSVRAKEIAKKSIINVGVGLILVLAGWLIIDFIMMALVNPASPLYGKWNLMECVVQPTVKSIG